MKCKHFIQFSGEALRCQVWSNRPHTEHQYAFGASNWRNATDAERQDGYDEAKWLGRREFKLVWTT